MLADKDELRKNSISTWRRVRVAGAIGVAAMIATLLLPNLASLFFPVWGISFLFVGGSIAMTDAYKRESRHKYLSAGIDRQNFLNQLIVREEIK